jgi:hypothetical protein
VTPTIPAACGLALASRKRLVSLFLFAPSRALVKLDGMKTLPPLLALLALLLLALLALPGCECPAPHHEGVREETGDQNRPIECKKTLRPAGRLLHWTA